MRKVKVRLHPTVQQLRNVMDERGLTVREVAALSGVAPNALFQWFQGVTSPTLSNLQRVLDALGLGLRLGDPVVVPNAYLLELSRQVMVGKLAPRLLVRKLAQYRGVPVEPLSKKVGYSRSTLYDSGHNDIRMVTVLNYLNALDVKIILEG